MARSISISSASVTSSFERDQASGKFLPNFRTVCSSMNFEPSEVVGTKVLAAFLSAVLTVLVGFMRLLRLMVLVFEAPEKALAVAGDRGFQCIGSNGFVAFGKIEERFKSDAFGLGVFVFPAFLQPEPALPVGFEEGSAESRIDELHGRGFGWFVVGKGDFRGIS